MCGQGCPRTEMPPCPLFPSGFPPPPAPFQLDQGEKAFARPRSRSSGGPPWERRRPRRHFFTSNEKSLHCECASLVVRAVIQAVVVAGLRLAWEFIGDVRAGMPADRRCLPARNASLVSAYRSPPPAASYNKTRGRRLSHGANLARAGHPLGPRASLPAVPSRAM